MFFSKKRNNLCKRRKNEFDLLARTADTASATYTSMIKLIDVNVPYSNDKVKQESSIVNSTQNEIQSAQNSRAGWCCIRTKKEADTYDYTDDVDTTNHPMYDESTSSEIVSQPTPEVKRFRTDGSAYCCLDAKSLQFTAKSMAPNDHAAYISRRLYPYYKRYWFSCQT